LRSFPNIQLIYGFFLIGKPNMLHSKKLMLISHNKAFLKSFQGCED